jgi:hypothetical protein
MKRISNKISTILLATLLSFAGCDYLDVVPDEIPTINHAFANRYAAMGFLYGIYDYIPDFADPNNNVALLGADEIWLCDNAVGSMTNSAGWLIARGGQNVASPLFNYWSNRITNTRIALFTALSDCNVFLDNIHKPFDLLDMERERWIAEVKFLKAYYHFMMLRCYGPAPLIKVNFPISESTAEMQRYREPIDSVVNYIVQLCDEAAAVLEPTVEDEINELGRATACVAKALKAQTLTLAASPLYNCNPDYAGFIDSRGIELFPQDKSQEKAKWERAAEAIREAIDYAEQEGGYKLFDFHADPLAVSLSEQTILAMQTRGAATERFNSEIIFGSTGSNTDALQRACYPFWRQEQSGGVVYRTYAPTLKIVEQFYTSNGIPIEDDAAWVGKDLFGKRTATTADKLIISPTRESINLHFDREARFYGAISFDGGRLYGNSKNNDADLLYIDLRPGTYGGVVTPGRYSFTGYLCKKLINFRTSLTDAGAWTQHRYAFPIIRLADLYLLYAEALNEIKDTPDDEVFEYIDYIRARTGLEGVVESWQKYAVDGKKNKPLSQEGMREIIRRERMNELAFEGSRFWDLRRWKTAENVLNQPVRGLNPQATDLADFYTDNLLYEPVFEKKNYLWPISIYALVRNKNLVQNPGW